MKLVGAGAGVGVVHVVEGKDEDELLSGGKAHTPWLQTLHGQAGGNKCELFSE